MVKVGYLDINKALRTAEQYIHVMLDRPEVSDGFLRLFLFMCAHPLLTILLFRVTVIPLLGRYVLRSFLEIKLD